MSKLPYLPLIALTALLGACDADPQQERKAPVQAETVMLDTPTSIATEHRELHGIHSILTNGKAGYARHPETMRWSAALSGLAARHRQLVAEMRLRGYSDRTPLRGGAFNAKWPEFFVTDPGEQVVLLRRKYAGKEKGRIPLPKTPQQLWAQHKYSVMARSPRTYQSRLKRSSKSPDSK